MKKYLLYNPLKAGFSNVWLSLEMTLALGIITNRTILVENDIEHYGYTSSINNGSIWEVLDINNFKTEWDIEFTTTKNKFTDIKQIEGCYECTSCYYNSNNVSDLQDFLKFIDGRIGIDCYNPNEVLDVGTLFGNFFYNVYLGDFNNRNLIKNKINKTITYKETYVNLSNQLIKDKFNAVHIRTHYSGLDTNYLEKLFDKNIPLYIATDIPSLNKQEERGINFKDYLFKIYKNFDNVITLDDFGLELTESEKIALDQLICRNAEIFHGTPRSTFSERINILRKIEGKYVSELV